MHELFYWMATDMQSGSELSMEYVGPGLKINRIEIVEFCGTIKVLMHTGMGPDDD
jgi:hypothetical protein